MLPFNVQAAGAVASATMTPLNVEVAANRLLELVAKVDNRIWSFSLLLVGIAVFERRNFCSKVITGSCS